LRTAIAEREIIQAVGRGRGVNRDATRPLNVFVLADAALPIPVTKLIRWTDVRIARAFGVI
jgi:putative DNA primase/helicase